MTWRKEAPQGSESAKVRWEVVPYTRGLVLDIGCGPHKGFSHWIGIDNRNDTRMFGIEMNPDLTVPDATKLPMLASCAYDSVFSSHLLEHVEDYKAALREWWRLVKPGGYLVLYLPHKSFYPNIGTDGANPDHKHDFLPSDIVEEMREIGGWDLVENQERNEDDEYSFLQVFLKYADAKLHRFSHAKPKPAKTCGIVRFGAWGDVIQASSILPALKEQGYHVTLMTVPRALEAIKHEPLIDHFILQDPDQVPNQLLGPYFAYWRKKFDKFVNLCEAVEGTFLAMPDRAEYSWPHAARHEYMNKNYIEFLHKIAEVPFVKPMMRFAPSQDETIWANAEVKRLKADPLIMWVLAGSSLHKIWAGGVGPDQLTGFDKIIAGILHEMPKARIIFCGGEKEKALEAPWRKQDRVLCRSGAWTIRQTMAMAQKCDVVIGPETGVLSAVSMMDMAKIVFLSHSSVENLTRDWVNTYSLFSTKTPCWPCHKMLYTWDQCMKADDEKQGVAHCQDNIPPEAVWAALQDATKTEAIAYG